MPDDLNAPVTDGERLDAARSASDDYDFLADVCDATGGIIDHDDITFEPRCVVALLDALCLARRRERALRDALDSAQRLIHEEFCSPSSMRIDCESRSCVRVRGLLAATDSAKGGR